MLRECASLAPGAWGSAVGNSRDGCDRCCPGTTRAGEPGTGTAGERLILRCTCASPASADEKLLPHFSSDEWSSSDVSLSSWSDSALLVREKGSRFLSSRFPRHSSKCSTFSARLAWAAAIVSAAVLDRTRRPMASALFIEYRAMFSAVCAWLCSPKDHARIDSTIFRSAVRKNTSARTAWSRSVTMPWARRQKTCSKLSFSATIPIDMERFSTPPFVKRLLVRRDRVRSSIFRCSSASSSRHSSDDLRREKSGGGGASSTVEGKRKSASLAAFSRKTSSS
mmetsp:Transcript_49226/g.112088  ORF Transcript_49226/g.112088 Transcript_49226/m.112088 type:complete len:281 (+) Transcript_49226:26-868(+)